MPDFQFVEDHYNRHINILAPRRASRPNSIKGTAPVCPFCPGIEQREKEVYRIGGAVGQGDWSVLVVTNIFPFAPVHEVIITSPWHSKNFQNLPQEHIEHVLQTYKARFLVHQRTGQVSIFHNHRPPAGESLDHSHSQLVVVPFGIHLDSPVLTTPEEIFETEHFMLFCPQTSSWPDEVWIVPKTRGETFGFVNDHTIHDLAFVLQRLLHIMTVRHGDEFPYNFYIYHGTDWYLRLIPRVKIIGGFELATNIYVNTQDPQETFSFIKEHFFAPDEEKIRTIQTADYKKSV